MLHWLGLTAALGLGGFDPIGAVALMAAVAAGARKRAVVAFTAGAVGIGLVAGILMASGLGLFISDLSLLLHRVTGAPWRHFLWGSLALVFGLAFIAWGTHLRRSGLDLGSFNRGLKGLGVKSMLISGVLVGAGVLTNPPFYFMLMVAGRPETFLGTVGVVLVWVLVAQSGMVIPTIALLLGVFGKLEAQLDRFRARVIPLANRFIPIGVIGIGALAVALGMAELLGIIKL